MVPVSAEASPPAPPPDAAPGVDAAGFLGGGGSCGFEGEELPPSPAAASFSMPSKMEAAKLAFTPSSTASSSSWA